MKNPGGENESIKEFESGRNAIFAIFDFFFVGKKSKTGSEGILACANDFSEKLKQFFVAEIKIISASYSVSKEKRGENPIFY